VSSAAFKDSRSDEVSVHLASLTSESGVLAGRPAEGLAEIQVGVPRSLGHAIVRDPEPTDPSHALICPPVGRGIRERMRDAKKMALQARLLVVPVGSLRS